MNNERITREIPPGKDTISIVNAKFHQYNIERTGDPNYEALAISLRDHDGQVTGGLLGCLYAGWLHIEVLWIEEALRNRGIGGQLISEAETVAIERKCAGSYIETSSPEARRLYQRLGYEIFETLDNYPKGHQKYFLKKDLDTFHP